VGGGAQTLAQATAYAFTPPVPPDVANFAAANNGEVASFCRNGASWVRSAKTAPVGLVPPYRENRA
jgi:hypothetical protein